MRPPEKLASFVRPAKAGVFSRVQPAGAKVRRPVAWMAGWRETETLKPIDKVSLGEIASHRAVMRVNAKWPRKQMIPRHPAEIKMPHRSDFGIPCCLRPSFVGSAPGFLCFRGHFAFTFITAR